MICFGIGFSDWIGPEGLRCISDEFGPFIHVWHS